VGEIFDYISSVLMGGMLMINIFSANNVANETYSVYQGDMTVQETLVTTVQVLEGEFRNMGFGVPEAESPVLRARDTDITFLIDLDRNGAPLDTVRYFTGDSTELYQTDNEHDRYVYRTVNGASGSRIGVVTMFRLRYLTMGGAEIPSPVAADRLAEIHEVEITLEVQSPYGMHADGTGGSGSQNMLYSSSYWQQTRLASQNSRR
jgi:hypothetical protein